MQEIDIWYLMQQNACTSKSLLILTAHAPPQAIQTVKKKKKKILYNFTLFKAFLSLSLSQKKYSILMNKNTHKLSNIT